MSQAVNTVDAWNNKYSDGDTIRKITGIDDTVEMQYMIMNLYAKAYMESVLWLKKEDPSGMWCPKTPWQLIRKLDVMIPDYFLY